MKYKLTYLISFALAIVVAFAFKNEEGVVNFFASVSRSLLQLGFALSSVFAILSISGSVAALRRTRSFLKMILKTLLWGLLSFVLSLIIAFIGAKCIVPLFGFNSASISQDGINNAVNTAVSMFDLSSVFSSSSHSIVFSSSFLLIVSIILASYIIGYNAKPDAEVIHPSYVFFNSLGEVGFRYANFLSKIYNVIIFFSTVFFIQTALRTDVFLEMRYVLLTTAIVALVLLFLVYPLMHLIFIRFSRKNPCLAIVSSLTVGLTAMFSNSVWFTLPLFETIARRENDIPKKYTASASPLFLMFIRTGVAVVSYMLVLLLSSSSVVDIALWKLFVLPFFIIVLSLVSGYMPGFEIVFVSSMALRFLGDPMDSSFYLLIALSPIFGALAAFIDTSSSFYGVSSLALQENELFGIIK